MENVLKHLTEDVIARTFVARNGELGFLTADTGEFLSACESESVSDVGWEMWLVDHVWGPTDSEPSAAPGEWVGLIPFLGDDVPGIWSDSGDPASVKAQLGALNWPKLIDLRWLPYVRINFAL